MLSTPTAAHNPERDRVSGVLLIAGGLCGVLVMAHHPHGRDLLESGRFASQAGRNALLHGAALIVVGAIVLGLLGLRRRLAGSDLATAAMVAYAFAAVAVISAAAASGFVATELIGRIVEAGNTASDTDRALLSYTNLLNGAFAKVHVVASSLSILLWGAAILRDRGLARAAGIGGVVIGTVLLGGFFAGHLRMDVHGFGIATFAQSAWLVWVGVLLFGGSDSPP
jgi:hypothetical protein